MIKWSIILLIFFIIFNLSRGLFFLLKPERSQLQVVKALTWRVGLSLGLLIFIMIAYYFGWLVPHAL